MVSPCVSLCVCVFVSLYQTKSVLVECESASLLGNKKKRKKKKSLTFGLFEKRQERRRKKFTDFQIISLHPHQPTAKKIVVQDETLTPKKKP
jgi:hypothetical protein